MLAKDPLLVKYDVQRHHCLGDGADGGVVLAGPQKGRWVALKYLSTEGYSPDREVKLLRQLKHPNVVELLEVVEPTKHRPQLVLVTPEADFDLRNYLGRCRGFPAASQGGNTRLSAEVVHCLATQLLAGISYLHAQRVVHRDLKPGNVLLTVVAPNLIHSPPSSLRLVLADFSRARILPSSWAPAASKGEPEEELYVGTSTSTGELMMMTPGVSTVAYSAPEVLQQARGRRCSKGHDDVCYGTAVDVWAFGAIHFELMTLDVLVRGETKQDVLNSIAWRLGRQELPQMDGMCAPLSTFAHLPGASLLKGALRWDPAERLAANTLWKQAQSRRRLPRRSRRLHNRRWSATRRNLLLHLEPLLQSHRVQKPHTSRAPWSSNRAFLLEAKKEWRRH